MMVMMGIGRRLARRIPGDVIDFGTIHVLKTLLHNGPLRLSALASLLDLDASTVSRHARQLQERGLVERTDDPADGRASQVMVSEEGIACLRAGAAARRSVIATALEPWPAEDREQLRVLLSRFYTDFTAAPEAAPGPPSGTGTSSGSGSGTGPPAPPPAGTPPPTAHASLP